MQFFRLLYKSVLDIIKKRNLLIELTKKEFQTRYLGSYLGIAWAFVQPIFNIMVLWFVFEIGFRSAPVKDFPFILWLVCGMVPWFFFSDSILSSVTSIVDNNYLVKKVVFPVSLLPFVKILSALVVHSFFIFLLFLCFIYYGYMPELYNLQIIYYIFATSVLAIGVSLITSSLMVFLRDIKEIVNMTMQLAFWFTPIFWPIQIIPEKYQSIIKLNPMYYIIEGYRNSFIYHKWFWNDINSFLYFWLFTIFILISAFLLYRKMRPHFADVL